jgi:hypothetical protein
MPAFGEFLIRDKRYFTVSRAREVIGPGVTDDTLARWCRRGFTPWDFELDVVRHPIVIHAKGQQATKTLEHRLLMSEHCTHRLKRLLSELNRPVRPWRFTNDELAALRMATRRLEPE